MQRREPKLKLSFVGYTELMCDLTAVDQLAGYAWFASEPDRLISFESQKVEIRGLE